MSMALNLKRSCPKRRVGVIMHRRFVVLFIQIFMFARFAEADVANMSFLKKFKDSTYAAMNEIPQKSGADFDPEYLEQKIAACRQSRSRFDILAARKIKVRGAAQLEESGNDNVANFLETKNIENNIDQLDLKYKSGSVDVRPWSGDYWAIYSGSIAKRYSDPQFMSEVKDWMTGIAYFLKTPSVDLTDEVLSPAEKYDRIVADENYGLTNASWNEGKKFKDEKGKVESWMGLCHGWAPASFMEPRPVTTKSVKQLNSDSVVRFRPDDIKALLTLKWANGVNVTPDLSESATRFLGGRCNVKSPKMDDETGRIIDPECFDLNPGAWHVAITNQIAGEKRPLIIDASFDYQVWNHPVTAYKYQYFNPKTLLPTDNLADATVKLSDPEFKDKFKKFRNSSAAVSVVGIGMQISYVIEKSPRAIDEDSESQDRMATAAYYYDLEIDKDGKIVGGEWYQNRHPDFIWMPMKNSIVLHSVDLSVNSPEEAMRYAPYASNRSMVLKYVLNYIQGVQ